MLLRRHLIPAKRAFNTAVYRFTGASFHSLHSSADSDECIQVHSPEHEVVIALGSNVGNRVRNFNEALSTMNKSGISVTRHGCLYETAPAYVTDQPNFLNSAVRAVTKLLPHELLGVLKKIEKEMGRTEGIRYGPRPIDLDILFYGKIRVHSDVLTVPHERIWERPFVMAPLIDLLGTDVENDTVACWHSFGLFESWEKLGGEGLIGGEGMKRVLPIGEDRLWDWSDSGRASVMGVVNLTPDSFSDGGKFQSVDDVVSQVRVLISEGADIVDFGPQSTRPMAERVSVQEELDRLIPVLEAVTKMPEMDGKLVSVDTFYSEVASEAVSKGAHIVNDVSGGMLDSSMNKVVADLGVPYIVMHMRGNPETMQSATNLDYGDDVCKQVGSELYSRVGDAERCGVPAWRMITDPGLGFSKNTKQNLEILGGLPAIRGELARRSIAVSRAPMLIGPSRKRFLGEVCSKDRATDRDAATVAAVTAGVMGGANVVRVHNVGATADAVKLCDAMMRCRR
ncbi:Folate synthesis bifunctional protein, mitochondrial [Linum perenne]